MKRTITTLIVFCFFTQVAYLQTQVVKGIIIDQQSEIPLIGATVALVGNENVGTTTDVDGYFRLENVPVGRQSIVIRYLGYDTRTLPNILVTAGKEVQLNIGLEESIESLQEVVVKANTNESKANAQNEMATISARTFSLEEVNRFSGGRSDVARLAGNFAGVANADDSRNDIVIRGNSPTGVLWRLEGIPIPNPNHFSTLGTTGGPVSALNPNVLRNSDFLTGAFPAEYGNALAGVFDLNFRTGNRDKFEFTGQLGAISGLEMMLEGPLNKKNGGSYLVAGRYSFVALASELGLPTGTNANPDYRDLAFKLDFGNGKSGRFTLFGMGGTSDIDFLREDVDEDDLFAAEDEDAFAVSGFGVVGLKHNLLINNTTYWRTVVSFATSSNQFDQDRYFNLDQEDEFKLRLFTTDNTVNRVSLNSFVNKKFNAKLTARTGILVENEFYDIEARDRENRPDIDDDGTPDFVTIYSFNESATIWQPYSQIQYRLNSKWTLNAGLHAQYLSLNETFALEPRVAINWALSPQSKLSLGYGLHHQTQALPILLLEEEVSPGVFQRTNENLGFSRSNHFVLGYDLNLGGDWRAKAEVYYQSLDNIPVESDPSSFSILNIGADFGFPDDRVGLVNEGTGSNYGFELTLEKFFSRGYYTLITASIFDSQYEGSDGVERNTAFNNQYVLNILGGKEFQVGKSKQNAITIDTKLTFAGGRYYTPVNLEASREIGQEVLFEDLAFSERYSPYTRWDLKFGFRKNSTKAKVSQTFFIDLQNVLNIENIFVRRYNRVTNQINEVNQIGFFPDILYRLQF
ncbi:MAG: TonB-dependent receptor [Bacteroidota bacterium]